MKIAMPKHVYFLRPIGEIGPVKIGCSEMPVKRLRCVEIWSPVQLELIVSVPGDCREESILHQMFGDQRRHGEWFDYSDQLGSVIDFAVKTGKLPPLDYSLRPHIQKRSNSRARSKMVRRADPRVTAAKCTLTQRIRNAEARVFTVWGIGEMRSARIQEIWQSYQGFTSPLPSPEQMMIIEEYIAALGTMPAAARGFGHSNWRDAVKATLVSEKAA